MGSLPKSSLKMGIHFRKKLKRGHSVWEGTDELKFSRKTYTDFSNKVWQDQSRFKGLAKDFRFDATLVGCASYEEMVLDAAEKICNNCGNERKKALCKEMELILSKRRREFESLLPKFSNSLLLLLKISSISWQRTSD